VMIDRIRQIDGFMDRLNSAVSQNARGDDLHAIEAGLGLLHVGLYALTEIADAQQRQAAALEADFEAAVAEQVKAAGTAAVEEYKKSAVQRDFIGRG
jgi:hypothetical protein